MTFVRPSESYSYMYSPVFRSFLILLEYISYYTKNFGWQFTFIYVLLLSKILKINLFNDTFTQVFLIFQEFLK